MTAQITQTASLAPGTCLLSGDFHGPFVDTGKSLRGYGRVYLSIKALGPLMREAGWKPLEEVETALERSSDRLRTAQRLSDEAEAYQGIVEALRPFLPEPEPVERQVAVFQDTRVREENKRLREQVSELKAQLEAAKPEPAKESVSEETVQDEEDKPELDLGTLEVKGQEVDLSDLLARPIDTIVSVVGRSPEMVDAVLEAERKRAESLGKRPRVTLRTRLEELR